MLECLCLRSLRQESKYPTDVKKCRRVRLRCTESVSEARCPGQDFPAEAGHRPGNACLRARFNDALQLNQNVVRRLPTCVGVFGETGAHHMIQHRRSHGLLGRDERWLRGHDGRDQTRLARALECLPPGRHYWPSCSHVGTVKLEVSYDGGFGIRYCCSAGRKAFGRARYRARTGGDQQGRRVSTRQRLRRNLGGRPPGGATCSQSCPATGRWWFMKKRRISSK